MVARELLSGIGSCFTLLRQFLIAALHTPEWPAHELLDSHVHLPSHHGSGVQGPQVLVCMCILGRHAIFVEVRGQPVRVSFSSHFVGSGIKLISSDLEAVDSQNKTLK